MKIKFKAQIVAFCLEVGPGYPLYESKLRHLGMNIDSECPSCNQAKDAIYHIL